MSEAEQPNPSELIGQAPPAVSEYAQTCVRYVRSALGFELDFATETLPVLDHYLRDARRSLRKLPESAALLAAVAGSYIGEVLRQRHNGLWDVTASDPLEWRLTLLGGLLEVYPVGLASVALHGAKTEKETSTFRIEDQADHAAVRAKLLELPQVDEQDYVAPSTRVEVVDIMLDTIVAHRQHRARAADEDSL